VGAVRDQSYQSVSRETFWYDLDQESYKPALIAWREMVRSLGKQNACREGLGVLCIRGCALFNIDGGRGRLRQKSLIPNATNMYADIKSIPIIAWQNANGSGWNHTQIGGGHGPLDGEC
jgi:hypothetical protein